MEHDRPLTLIREIDPRTDPRWEAFVAGHPHGLVYHHPAWLEVLDHEYGERTVMLGCEDEHGELQGVLPLCATRGVPFGVGGPLVGPRLSSLPRTPIGGPLTSCGEAASALVHAAVARLDGVRRLELRPPPGAQRIPDAKPTPWCLSYVAELPDDPAQLRFGNARAHATIKRAVNKSIRAGVRVRPAESEAELRAWYRLYLQTMREHVAPPRPYSFFLAVWRLLRPRGLSRLLVAEIPENGGRRLLAGSLFFTFGATVSFAFNGRDSRALALRPNDAIHWEAIHDACREGYKHYDLGEVTHDQPGLGRFKAKWGAEPRPLVRYYHPPLSGLSGAATQSRWVSGLKRAIWPRLPLGATEVIGTRLYRYL
jgi:CelD/BcsL family acetyltransferase involved in cellulose biosynthesis